MNPLSPLTYYRRHKPRAVLLLSLTGLVTAGLYLVGALIWGIFFEPARLSYLALSKFSLVTLASGEDEVEVAVLDRLLAHPDVVRVLPTSAIIIQLPGLVPGESFQFELRGLTAQDLPYVLETCGATLQRGQLPEPGTNGLLLSEDVAAILGVELGDRYDATSSEIYAGVATSQEATALEVVGILESDLRLGIVSLEYLEDHELYRSFPAQFLVTAREDRESAVDDFLRREIQTTGTEVSTLTMLNERITREALPGLGLLVPPVLIVTLGFSLVIVVANRIANARRLSELGIMHAMGLSKEWLIHRLTMETATLTMLGWTAGIGLAWLVLYLLRVTFFVPRGYDLGFIAWIPMVFALPVPAAVVGFTFISVRRTFSRLDAVAVVERGELSQEREGQAGWTAAASSPQPLAAATFYRRHRRREVLLISGTSLMIMSVVLIIFALSVAADAQEPLVGYLSRVSMVRSPDLSQGLEPEVVARVMTHPAVERVIPVAPRFHMLGATIPPFTGAEASPFGVYTEDMAYLIDLFGLELKEGHMPRPQTNEMVIPETLAQNRRLEVGDVIGNPEKPAYAGAPSLATEFVISGIVARPSAAEEENWLGFVSLEFLETYQPFPLPDVPPLIVVPRAGQKDVLDTWLESELAGADASVMTYRQQIARMQGGARQQMSTMALLEGAIALVAAIALTVLNHIFFSQRHGEFGVLHALGYGRQRLVLRVLGETLLTTGLAWSLSAVLILAAMLYLRLGMFASLGLTFDLFNASPWLHTLPIPIAMLAGTTATTARMLSRLDPVAIIERR